jgi:hypothetical protein
LVGEKLRQISASSAFFQAKPNALHAELKMMM